MRPDVARRDGPQERVRDGVQYDVGVGMSEQPSFPRNVDPTDAKRATRRQPMDVPSLPDSEQHCLLCR
jgi:hypothetical protein